MVNKILTSYNFARVVKNKKSLRKHGLDRGTLLFINGVVGLPHSKTDMYVTKDYMSCSKVIGDHVQLPSFDPKNKESHKNYIVDGMSLEWVGEEEQERLLKILDEDVEKFSSVSPEDVDQLTLDLVGDID